MAGNEPNITIIKRKKVIAGGGHHGGAWKVAYADFVTAMMAFFLLMWLLNATTERQRKGIADYFTPTIALSPISGGGDGVLQGDSMLSQETLARSGVGGREGPALDGEDPSAGTSDNEAAELAELQTLLAGSSGESDVADNLLSHIVTRVTDEGLVVDIFAKEGRPLFDAGSPEPTVIMDDILAMVADVLGLISNSLRITGHTDAAPFATDEYDNWRLSADRADAVRRTLGGFGVAADRFDRISGEADRNLALPATPLDPRNRRITLVIRRSDTR